MNSDNQLHNDIDKFLNGEMSKEEMAAFTSLIDNDAEVKKELELEQTLRTAVDEAGLLSFQNAIEEEGFRRQRMRTIRRWFVFLTGGVLVLAFLYTPFGVKFVELFDSNPNDVPLKTEDDVFAESSWESENEEPQAELLPTQQMKEETEVVDQDDELKSYEEEPVVRSEEVDSSLSRTDEVDPTIEVDISSVKTETSGTNKSEPPVVKVDSCEGVVITFDTEASPQCANGDGGSVEIVELSEDGTYQSMLLGHSGWSEQMTYEDLTSGNYEVQLRDENGCLSGSRRVVTVGLSNCFTPEKGFNPDFETWEYINNTDREMKITIKNKRGIIIDQSQFEDRYEWDGSDTKGDIVQGIYMYILEVPGKKDEIGTVTVVF